MVDYIVVGLGLAGIAFCEELEKNNHSFTVFEGGGNVSSVVAAGLYNPVILKRFTIAWNAPAHLKVAKPFYKNLEKKLNVKLDYPIQVLRRFASVEEQNLWFEASDRPQLDKFLSTTLQTNENSNISAPLGFGEVLHTGRIDTSLLITTYQNYLDRKNLLRRERFDYNKLVPGTINVYDGVTCKHIVFAEGFGLINNPFFNYLPLDGSKGELLTIHAPDLKLDKIINASVFIIPIENDFYKVGATYHKSDKTHKCTEEARNQLIEGLDKLINCPYEIVNQEAGIRPTVNDRLPLAGQHPIYKNLFVLNGLGTRGVIIGPAIAAELYLSIEQNIPLQKEIDIKRVK